MRLRRRLGRSSIEVSPIGLGCWQFSQRKNLAGGFWESVPADVVQEIVQTSLDGGVNWFDTAQVYGNGRSEEMLAEALKACGKAPGDVVVATKWWPTLRCACNIKSTIGERLERLGGFPIDLHQVHQPLSISSVEAQMNAMADLVEREQIRTVGVSNFSTSRMRDAHAFLAMRGIPLVSNQMPYSLLDRRIESNGLLAAARELGITLIAYSPLAQGLLSGKFHDDPDSINSRPGPRKWMPSFKEKGLKRTWPLIKLLREIADAHGVSSSQVALNWLVTFYGDMVVAIPGATRSSHAKDNVGAMAFDLSHKELQAIDRASRQLM
ncbi:MAG: aldo/keto reductase [Deltaproteobacteria bacterium]|nr:aldo/keto reductase [Deltaproteobacteria bacterium]